MDYSSGKSWELSKENIQPIRGGRSVLAIDEALQMSSEALRAKQQNFEEQLRTYDGHDPLDVWYRYFKWMEEHHPKGKEKQIRSLIQNCLRTFHNEMRYKNDGRYFKIWLKYAQMSSSIGNVGIFESMYKGGDCTELSDLYIHWADAVESGENYAKTDEIFRVAVENDAKPMNKLELAKKQFEERMAIREMQKQQSQLDTVDDDSTRMFLGNLKGIGRKSEAPVIRVSSGSAPAIVSHRSAPNLRPAIENRHQNAVFEVFKQSTEMEILSKMSKAPRQFPFISDSVHKENVHDPGVWNKPSVKRHESVGIAKMGKPIIPEEIHVYRDTEPSKKELATRRQTFAVDVRALRPSKSPADDQNPLTMLTSLANDPGTLPQYAKMRIYNGGAESSFEELRAADLARKNAQSRQSASEYGHRKGLAMRKSPDKVAKPTSVSPCAGNSSFTRNMYSEAMAVFSDTINMPNLRNPPEPLSSDVDEHDFKLDTFANIEQSFQVFSDVPKRVEVFDENDKENDKPSSLVVPPTRQKSGILSPAKDFDLDEPMDAQESVPVTKMMEKVFLKMLFLLIEHDDWTIFDPNEPTLARFESKTATCRASSTPCNQGLSYPPCFSVPRQWNQPELNTDKEEFRPLVLNLPNPDDLVIPAPVPVPVPVALSEQDKLTPEQQNSAFSMGATILADRRLSAIAETSKDCRSGSSCFSSGSSNGSLAKRTPMTITPTMKMPIVKSNITVALGGETFRVDALIGEGAFARIYRCLAVEDGHLWVIKSQKPSCAWEFYICEELRKRLPCEFLSSVMSIRDAFIFHNGSLLVNDYHSMGTLLDLNNRYEASGKRLGEYLTVYLTIRLIRIIEITNEAQLIHGDVKPDNFLITSGVPLTTDVTTLLDESNPVIKLIDWGRAIDMKFMKGRTFSGRAGTSAFDCCEMRDNRPWTYQTDLFGLLGTVHVMLFGKYMNIFKENDRYRTTSTVKRQWNRPLWNSLIDSLLNIPDCSRLPKLTPLRRRFETYLGEILASPDRQEWLVSVRQFNELLVDNS